jgi:hypothetical protein
LLAASTMLTMSEASSTSRKTMMATAIMGTPNLDDSNVPVDGGGAYFAISFPCAVSW